MRKRHLSAVAVIAGALAGLVGCETSGYTRAGWTRSDVTATQKSSSGLQEQLATAVHELSALVEKPEPDLKAKFDKFSAELTRAQSASDRLRSSAVSMQNEGEQYFAAWDAEMATIGDAEIRGKSEQRRTSALQNFRSFAGERDAARQTVNTLLSTLSDVRRHLTADLTPRGVSAIADVAARARTELNDANTRLQAITTVLSRIDSDLSPGEVTTKQAQQTKAKPSSEASVDSTK